MLSADSLISGHHVFTPEDGGELPPSSTSPEEPLPLHTNDPSKSVLWNKLHAATSSHPLVKKGSLIPGYLGGVRPEKPTRTDPLTGIRSYVLRPIRTDIKLMVQVLFVWARRLNTKTIPRPIKGLPREE